MPVLQAMFYNHLKIALRNLLKNKLHSGINILGLAIGISACFTIIQLVRFDYNFDKFHPNAERIYRLYSSFSGKFTGINSGVSAPLPEAIASQVSGVAAVSPLHYLGRSRVEVVDQNTGNQVFPDERGIAIVAPDYFTIFSAYEWLHGSPTTTLTAPHQVVLSEARAQRYFGTTDALSTVGRELIYRDSLRVTVAGIVKNFPHNSDLIFEDFISFSTIRASWLKKNIQLDNWTSTNSNAQAFLLLKENSSEEEVLAATQAIYDSNRNREVFPNFLPKFKLQPLSELHFNPELGVYNNNRTAHRPTLYALSGIALILLLIAGINFVNLVTAQATQRSKEVGVRKVLGSSQWTLIQQFLSETFLMTTLATLLALVFGFFIFEWFAEFLPAQLTYAVFELDLMFYLLLIIAVVSILAGLYPAFISASFQPVNAIKGQISQHSRYLNNNYLRRGLIVFQFAVALVLITTTFIIGKQLQFIQQKDLGFDQEAILYSKTPWQKGAEKKLQFKKALAERPSIQQISVHHTPPVSDATSANFYDFPLNGELQETVVFRKSIDEHYLDLYDIELLAGRTVTPTDSLNEIVVNERLLYEMQISEPTEALGKHLIEDNEKYVIIGVVKDFHHQDLHHKIAPLLLTYGSYNSFISYKFHAQTDNETIEKTLQSLAQTWNTIYPETPFDYHFYDESIAQLYQTERRTAKLLQTATLVAILISCMGLFGLVSFTVARRHREIGIRKVLGASVADIVSLLSKDFVVLVLIAIMIGAPLAYYAVLQWLTDFAYRIELQWWMFVVTGAAALGLAFLTVGVQSMQAALTNPVETLRDE